MLRRWWTKKYQLPWTPNNICDFTVLDLLTEFYEDLFEDNKTALYEASRDGDGEIMFESTGDDLIDKWERELAMGLEPDLTEGMSEDSIVESQTARDAKKAALKKLEQVSSINENFGLIGSTATKQLSPLDLLGKGK